MTFQKCVLIWSGCSPLEGGVLTLTWYTLMCLSFSALFLEIWYSDLEFSSETKEPKLHNLGVFGGNYCKKHPNYSKLGAFLSKMVYQWVGNWYRESQIFEVPQAHPRTILVIITPGLVAMVTIQGLLLAKYGDKRNSKWNIACSPHLGRWCMSTLRTKPWSRMVVMVTSNWLIRKLCNIIQIWKWIYKIGLHGF